jgi:predicted TIM-barrel fold metal-dependent hydrolase
VKKIDVYSHILPPAYFKEMQRHVTDPGALKRWLELPALHDVPSRLEMMATFGDSLQQVLTLSSPPIEILTGPEESPALARVANETMRDLVEQHPNRFPWFVASLPMNNIEACMTEIAYSIDELGAVGVQLFTNVNGRPLDDPEFLPIFDEMARRDLPIWMHPTRNARFADYATETTSKFEIWWAFGWPYETSVAMARMVFSGLFERHPALKIITHHLGAMIPFFEGRIGMGWSDQLGTRTDGDEGADLATRLPRRPLDYFQMFYADTAISGSRIALRCGLDFFGSEHVMFGSDCPFDPEGGPGYIREIIAAVEQLDLDPATQQLLYEGNIRRLIAPALRRADDAVLAADA